MTEIKAILIDFDGIVVVGKKKLHSVLSETLGLEENKVKEVITDLWPSFTIGRLPEEKFWKEVGKRLSIQIENPEDLWKKCLQETKPNQEAVDIIKTLLDKNYIVGIISNIRKPETDYYKEKGWYNSFQPVILSYEYHCMKPDVEFYKLALEKLGLEPEQVVFIDDSLNNLLPANQLGMNTIHFTTVEGLKLELEELGVEI